MTDRSVVYKLRAEVTQFRASMAAAGASVKDAGNKMTAAGKEGERFRQGLTGVAKAAGKVGLVAGAGLAAFVVSAANFDQAMSSVSAATHESAANMDRLREAAIKAGQETKFSATEAAGGIEALAKAGVSVKDILDGGLTGALSLAAAGNQSVADSAETAASAMTQFALSGSDIPHIADLLAAGAGKAQGEVSDLAQALNQTGLVAHQSGLTVDETTAALSAFASAGLIGSDAGTSFKTMLLRLTPTSTKAAELMDDLGLSAFNSQGQFIGLSKYAGVLHGALKDMSAEQRNAALQTIFGSDAIRAATILYDQGARGIDRWTQKVDDQGFAADTAARKMDNLKGDLEQLRGSLETFLITGGESSQGPLRSLTQHMTEFVNAANEIPGPAKKAGTALLGIATVTGGGIYFGSKVVDGIANMRTALDKLGFEAATTRQKVALVGVSGTAAALGIGALLNTITQMDAISRSRGAADATVKSFQDLADALQYSNVGKNAEDLHIDLARLSEDLYQNGKDGEYASRVMADLQDRSHGFGALLNSEVGHITLGQLGGSADKASDAYKDLQAIIANSTDTLGQGATETENAAAANKDLAHQLGGASLAAQQMNKALEKNRKVAHETASGFIGLGKSLDDNSVSLSDWIKQLQRQADALKNFRENAQKAAEKGLNQGLTKALEKAGPEGALRMRQLANATKEQIDQANDAWKSGQRQITLYTNQIGGVPKTAHTKVYVDGIDPALAKLETLAAHIRDIRRNVDITTTVHTTGGRVLAGNADGGTIAGERYPYGDKVLRMLAPGEEVISNRHGQADRWRPLLKAINSGMANGGTVGPSSSVPLAGMGIDYDRLARTLAGLRPLYGDVHVNGDPTSFRQRMQQDAAMAAMSGVRRG